MTPAGAKAAKSPVGADEQILVEPLLGEADAATEWADPEQGHAVFLHTQSYDSAIYPHVLFLFGRRGTGKTAVLRMLQYETRAQQHAHYLSSWLLDQTEAYHQLSQSLRHGPFAAHPEEHKNVAAQQWCWLLNVGAMCGVVWQASRYPHRELENDQAKKHVKIMRKFLAEQDVLDVGDGVALKRDPLLVLLGIVSEVATTMNSSGLRAITTLGQRLWSPEFREAQGALHGIIQSTRRSPLVLVDSIDEYNITDDCSRAVVVGLLQAGLKFYADRGRGGAGVLAKAAFPSEIYPSLPFPNAEKAKPASSFIMWARRNLKSLIAKRYCYYATGASTYRGRALDDPEVASAFFAEYFPDGITTPTGAKCPGFDYVLRHTQRKPRQLIALFNTILSLAKAKGIPASASLPPDVIVDGVQMGLGSVAESTCQVFELIYPEATNLIRRTLGGMPATFPVAHLERSMKRVADVRHRHKLSLEEVYKLLIDAGILGVVTARSEATPKSGLIIQARFQYQVPETINLFSETTVAIHPMFYSYLSTSVPPDVFVYPAAADDVDLSQGIEPTTTRRASR